MTNKGSGDTVRSGGKWLLSFGKQNLKRENIGIILFLVVLFIVFSITSDTFLKPRNLFTILRQVSVLGICAFGGAAVLLIGGIDLSVGSCAAFTGVFTALLIQKAGLSIPVSCIMGVILGGVVGLINGSIITKIGIPPIVTTLGTMTLFRGLAYVLCGKGEAASYGIINLPKEFKWIGSGYIADVIPVPVIFMIIVFLVLLFVLNRMPFGRHIYAIGSNEESAIVSGINTDRVKMMVFTISGLCAGIGGVILASRMNSGQPTAAQGLEIDVLTAIVMGSVSTVGGKGKLSGVIIGVFIIGILQNGLILLNVPYFYQLVIKGLVLISAVTFDLVRARKL